METMHALFDSIEFLQQCLSDNKVKLCSYSLSTIGNTMYKYTFVHCGKEIF